MFNDSNNGQTQYCEECLEKQKRIDELEKENKELKDKIAEAVLQIAFCGSKYGFGSNDFEKYNKDWEEFNKSLNLTKEEWKDIDDKVKNVGKKKC